MALVLVAAPVERCVWVAIGESDDGVDHGLVHTHDLLLLSPHVKNQRPQPWSVRQRVVQKIARVMILVI